MRTSLATVIATMLFSIGSPMDAAAKTLVVLAAHADDEGPVAPILARYAREGADVYLIIATDGGQGSGSNGSISRPDLGLQGDTLVSARAAEARCATDALGIHPPILLGFPDGKLGDYIGDRSLIRRLTERIAAELQRIRPDAVVTWGPDGGGGHPDHRIVSSIGAQLVRAEAPGVPDRLFYMTLSADAMRAMNPQRGAPPLVVPAAKYFTVRVPFTERDFDAALRGMRCHRSQFTDEAVKRVGTAAARELNGRIALVPAFTTVPGVDLFSPGVER